jgi:hypothetical protein
LGKFKGRDNTRWKPKVTLQCAYCELSYKVHPYRQTISKYCSRKCQGAHKKEINFAFPLVPPIGKHEKPILDTLENMFGYTIIRQHKVGRYFLDGYCPALKLAIEIDEPHHRLSSKQLNHDIKRQNCIEQLFGYTFLRINTE